MPAPEIEPEPEIDVEPLQDLAAPERERVRAIYEEAFPARQRVAFDEILDGARSGEEIALVGMKRGSPVGLAFLSRLDSAAHVFLEYFAIDGELRGAGHGGRLWLAVRDELAEREDGRPIVLEVEDPAEAGIAPDEAGQRVRRVRFWQRAGAVALPVDGYVIPDVDGDGSEPMLLMWVAPRPAGEPPSGARLLELVLALYESGYGLSADDLLVRRARQVLG
jgi:GNAT superfamily N-acetyltransferase